VGLLEQVAKYGIAFVFGNVLLEQIGLPIPALPTLIVAGALAARGDLSAPLVLLVAVVASLIADLLWFALGRRQGYRVLNFLCRVSLSPDSCVNQTEAFFSRYGLASLLFAKFVPGFSTVAPPLAGASNASVASFMAWDAGGALLWAGSGFAAGAIFHRAVDRVLDVLASFGGGALVFVGSALVLFILWKYAQRRRFYRALRMARISPQEVSDLIARGESPVILDVRSARAREADPRRIPGARPLELAGVEAGLSDLPRDREIILYCT
jgi:membrane protein DedA with SNARE-associated domain